MHHVAHFLVYKVLAKFQLFCIITCRDILYFVFWLPYYHTLWRHLYLICIIHKSWISLERDEIWQKGKHHSSSFLKAFEIRLFFNTSIFHFIGTLKGQTKTCPGQAKFKGQAGIFIFFYMLSCSDARLPYMLCSSLSSWPGKAQKPILSISRGNFSF